MALLAIAWVFKSIIFSFSFSNDALCLLCFEVSIVISFFKLKTPATATASIAVSDALFLIAWRVFQFFEDIQEKILVFEAKDKENERFL